MKNSIILKLGMYSIFLLSITELNASMNFDTQHPIEGINPIDNISSDTIPPINTQMNTGLVLMKNPQFNQLQVKNMNRNLSSFKSFLSYSFVEKKPYPNFSKSNFDRRSYFCAKEELIGRVIIGSANQLVNLFKD